MRPPLHGILETALYVADLDASQEFYARVFGLQVLLADGRMRALRISDGQVLLLFKIGGSTQGEPTPGGFIPPHDGRGQLHLAFSAAMEDMDAWNKYLRAAGIEIESEVWANAGRSIYFRDPDSHAIEIGTLGLWQIQDAAGS
jgi:catechol 2,3-dioxygenase-like lactoylglutathione lyase family enzyme